MFFVFVQSIGSGSGLFGSITSADLSKASKVGAAAPSVSAAKPSADGAYADLPVSAVRGVIAKRLLQSKQVGRRERSMASNIQQLY